MMIGSKVLHYEIVEALGEGGMGVVYKARDTRLNRSVALKFISPARLGDTAERARLVHEARTVAALRHPNICTVYDIDESPDGQTFISMAYLKGKSLHDRIAQDGPLPIDESIRIVTQIAEGLREAHANGIIHRDIKSANIILTEKAEAVILDFGLAKVPASGSVTQTDAFTGTVSYASPEQIRGDRVDHRTDLWSLGVVWYEMLTGKLPFAGDSMATVIHNVLDTTPTPAHNVRTEVPAEIERVLDHLLTKDPKRRTSAAADLIEELAEIEKGVAGAARTPSIAVLPFANMSNDPEQSYFCDGIAEDIINDLTRIEGLRVASRTTSFAHRAASIDMREIGHKIGVDSVLEGSVRKAGNRIRITAQLIDVSNGYHIWSERWDRELADVFAIQDEISDAITAALRVKLTSREQTRDKKATTNLEAHDLYLRGRALMHQGTRERLAAQSLFHRAIDLDPGFARAHASLATLSLFLYQFATPDPRYLHEGLEASHHALALDPDLGEAHAARGFALASTNRLEEAEREFAKAMEINPDLYDSVYFLARLRFMQGRMQDAYDLFERATQLDPDEYQCACLMVNLTAELKMGKEVVQAAARRALERADRHLEKYPSDTRAKYLSVGPLEALGRGDEAVARSEEAIAMDPLAVDVYYNAACHYALRGNVERSLDALEKAIERGFNSKTWLEHDTDFDPVRSDPRFAELLARVK